MKPTIRHYRNFRLATTLPLACVVAFCTAQSASAVDITWTSLVAGNWSDSANWDLARVPISTDDVILNNGSTIEQITAQSGANMATLTLDAPSVATVLNYGGATPYVQNMYGGTAKPLIRITSNASAAVSVNKVNFKIRESGELEIASGKTFTLGNSYISENSTGLKLTKTGGGTLTFSGTGEPKISFTGGLDMQEGTWTAASKPTSLPATGLVNFTNTLGTAAKITVNTNASIEALAGGNADSLIDGNSTLTVTGAQTTTYAGIIGGSVKLTHSGAGSLELTGSNTYTGVTTITGGTLSTGLLANGGTASGIGAATNTASNLVIDGGTLKYTGGAASINRSFTIGLNGATIDRSTGSGQLDFSSLIAYSDSGARTLTVTTNSSGAVRLRGAIADSGGATTVVKQGAGQLMLTGSSTYTGQLQILEGYVQFGNAGAGGESTGVGHTVAISSGAELRFRHATTAETFNGDISGAGSVQMNYNNSSPGGSLTLGGNNTFTGDLLLNPSSGTEVLPLKAGSTTALGSGNVVFGPYGKLDLNGFNVTAGLLRGLSGAPNGIVTNDGGSDSTLTLDSSDAQTFGGVIQDGTSTVSIVKDGAGTQTLSGINTYSGDTTVTEGTLSLGEINASNESSTVSVASGAFLDLTYAGTDTVDKLFLNGVQQAAGVYGSGNSGGRITGSGTLTVTTGPVASGFSSWIALFPAVGGQNQPGDDPDNDGMDNLLEFVLNGNPTVSDSSILPDLNASGSTFVFTCQRRDDSVSPETTQTFQYGSNLTGWTDVTVPATSGTVGAATITITDGSPTDTVQISIPKTEAGGSGKLFGRLQVVKP